MSKSNAGVGCLAAVGAIALVIALWLVIVGLSALVLMFAWNLVLPALFGWPVLTYPMAFGLSLLIGIIGSAFSRVTTIRS